MTMTSSFLRAGCRGLAAGPAGLCFPLRTFFSAWRRLLRIHFRLAPLAWLAAFTLTGCSSLPPAAVVDPQPVPDVQLSDGQAAAQSMAGFISRQQTQAEQAEKQGHWALAAWHWEAIRALRPQDTTVMASQQRALQAAESLAALRVSQARLALQLGDLESAREWLLRALATQLDLPEAIEGVKQVERSLTRKRAAETVSRHRLNRMSRPPAAYEHAQLLALQGELAAAVDLLCVPWLRTTLQTQLPSGGWQT